ncbi:MAG: glycine cleavage system protein H [Planctomycetota bacterium]
MIPSLTFMMGEFEAEFPTDRKYASNHMWAQPGEDGLIRFGFTAYAVRLLQDVYFLDWTFDAPKSFAKGDEMGSIESKKAESSLYSPDSGQLVVFNDQLMDDPSAINTDKYVGGWLFDMKSDGADLLSAEQYVELLEDVWKKTQRTIKGQMNE